MEICVVTRVPESTDSGNLAMARPLFRETERPSEENGWHGANERLDPVTVMLGFKQVVFELGEIFIIGSDDRQIGYNDRKPSKWDVGVEFFPLTVEGALAADARSREVLDA